MLRSKKETTHLTLNIQTSDKRFLRQFRVGLEVGMMVWRQKDADILILRRWGLLINLIDFLYLK
jgi:hypothetical protein